MATYLRTMVLRVCRNPTYTINVHKSQFNSCSSCKQSKKLEETQIKDEEEFRVYEIEGLVSKRQEVRRKRFIKKMPTPRFTRMAPDQDWTEVWPSAETFKWSAVPFPVRQGYIKGSSENEGVVPSKYANLELMKIPNFLHLSPAHIKKHCAAIKKFCTPWPEALDTDERCREAFPVESVTCDYVFASPSVRDDRARIASIRFQVSDLDLDYHARDKFIRLVGHRFNPKTGQVVFESDKCPLKTQNLDYVKFLLTATYFESWKREDWEDQKQLCDMEAYFWDINASRPTVLNLLQRIKDTDQGVDIASPQGQLEYLPSEPCDEDTLCALPQVQHYKASVEALFNEGENAQTLEEYKEAVKTLLNLKNEGSLT